MTSGARDALGRLTQLGVAALIFVIVYLIVSAWAASVLRVSPDIANYTGLFAGIVAAGGSWKVILKRLPIPGP